MATSVDVSHDLSILGLYGRNVILTAAGLFTTTALYGVYMVLFFAVVSILCRREGIMTARLALLAAVTLLFILSTVYLCTTFSYFIIGVRTFLVENAGTVPILDKNDAYIAKFHTLGVIGEVTIVIATVIGDAIVVWRAWALSGGNKKIMFLPVILFLGMTGTAFSFVGCMAQEGMPIETSPRCLKRNTATFVLSMLVNVAGTAAIGYQVWSYRRAVRKYLHNCRHQLRAEKILVMLVESGVAYTTLWIIQMSLLVSPATGDFTEQAFRSIFSAAAAQLVGIYPTLMIVLIFLRRSLWDSVGKSTICEDTSAPEQSADTTTHSSHEHDLMSSPKLKGEPGSLDVVFVQEKHYDGNSSSSQSPTV